MTLPRALPWAITFRALGAENQEFSHSLGNRWVIHGVAKPSKQIRRKAKPVVSRSATTCSLRPRDSLVITTSYECVPRHALPRAGGDFGTPSFSAELVFTGLFE